jgi:DNA-binding NarL/FixJ family response regulator
MLLADRLLRNRKRLPLLFALAYILPVSSMAGRAIANANAGIALEAGISLILALVFAFLLMRLRGALSGLPLTENEDAPMPEPGLTLAPGLTAFAATYGLSRQETLVLEMLVERRTTEDIAQAINVHQSTIKTYVSRMLQKAKVPNRNALIALYADQNQIPAEQTSPFHDPASR